MDLRSNWEGPYLDTFSPCLPSGLQQRHPHLSAGGYTEPALYTVREALQKTVLILVGLDEITFLLEQGKNLNDLLRQKVQAAILEKNPYKRG